MEGDEDEDGAMGAGGLGGGACEGGEGESGAGPADDAVPAPSDE